jgi:c(7)-type cytochrome triheme protein
MQFTRPLSIMVLLLAIGTTVLAIGGGDITFKPTGVAPVIFSHDHHAKTHGLKCVACHFQRFSKGQGYEMNKKSLTKRDFCSHCHNGMKSFDAAAAKNCARCHKK